MELYLKAAELQSGREKYDYQTDGQRQMLAKVICRNVLQRQHNTQYIRAIRQLTF